MATARAMIGNNSSSGGRVLRRRRRGIRTATAKAATGQPELSSPGVLRLSGVCKGAEAASVHCLPSKSRARMVGHDCRCTRSPQSHLSGQSYFQSPNSGQRTGSFFSAIACFSCCVLEAEIFTTEFKGCRGKSS